MEAIGKNMCGYQCFDMEPVYETVEEIEIVVRKKPFTSKLYYRKGLAKYIGPDGIEHISDITSFHDCGPDGVSSAFARVPEIMPTREECEEGRRNLREIVTQCMVRQGFW